MMLNDNIADGRDVSWIWDVDFERIVDHTATLTVTGTRSLDLALRLKYAGVAQETVDIIPTIPLHAAKVKHSAAARQLTGLSRALDVAIERTPIGETLFVIPTYTGLLEIHRELERRGLTPRYWEEKGP
jgi:UDP-N-acetylmuramyl tripeptide synthase